ncbi:cellobiose transport system permease protein [Paenibacillus cellulosilyticus]|uniref:Cellobiose transport system permease protein n=1 Tax=Paenibacillus cellulosilyticus TaxID=375489 RepID=A0A2V2Z226_9BACL|nr:carbohydrate ABC transporter permease [Paenibacillus cellulosilyticus]PWW07185.1 cellobiose transport system permease protein [Paenibacillus cellulosilyticus]QKS44612.1 carbohydrate ABC transporter permease [Paenibacillus cellulosilyticus]
MRQPIGRCFVYLILLIFTVFSLFPFYWMTVISTRTAGEISAIPPAIFYGDKLSMNLDKIFNNENVEFIRTVGNTAVITLIITLSMLLFSSLAGFAFAKLEFRGKSLMLLCVVGSLMIPMQLGIIPQYIIMSKLHWINDLKAVVVPGMVSAFGVFFMRQYIDSAIPGEMLEAGRIDGCSNWRLYWRIVVPTIAPAFATLGILTFMGAWNDYLWPSIVLKSSDSLTVQLALLRLDTSSYFQDKSIVMTGSVLSTLPLFLIFLAFNRQFIAGVTDGAVKG